MNYKIDPRRINRAGQRNGKLLVLGRLPNKKYLCKCDCGNLTVVDTSNLNRSGTRTCGCSRFNKRKKELSLEGKRFGDWEVLRRSSKKPKTMWLLQCKCGRQKYCSKTRLTKNDIPVCKNCSLIGKTYGKLTVLSSVKDPKKAQALLCRCQCGEMKEIEKRSLLVGDNISCGCYSESKKSKQLKEDSSYEIIKKDKIIDKNLIVKCICGRTLSLSKYYIKKYKTCGCKERDRNNGKKIGVFEVLSFSDKDHRGVSWYDIKCTTCGKRGRRTLSWCKTNVQTRCCEDIIETVNKSLQTRYHGMKARCLNIKNPLYKYYGGRGITICKQWKKDSESFYRWALNNGYEDNLELDRIDNNKGYFPGNCRFVTRAENLKNRNPYGAHLKRG